LSLFTTIRLNFSPHGLLELWSNLHRLGAEGVEYWYFFVRGEQTLWDNLKAGVKLAHTYRNEPDNRGETTFSLGVTADL
jgi:hypothetical protein